jgi:uncharacterized phiE125 gp8 family phage protein
MIIKRIKQDITAPDYFVSLCDAKTHLRIEESFTEDDGYIRALIGVAVERVNNYTNRSWSPESWKVFYSHAPFGTDWFQLDQDNIIQVTAIAWEINNDPVAGVLADFAINLDLSRIRHKTGMPSGANTFNITLSLGVSETKIPMAIRQAVLLYVTDYYEQRQNLTQAVIHNNQAAENLIYPYRVRLGM